MSVTLYCMAVPVQCTVQYSGSVKVSSNQAACYNVWYCTLCSMCRTAFRGGKKGKILVWETLRESEREIGEGIAKIVPQGLTYTKLSSYN